MKRKLLIITFLFFSKILIAQKHYPENLYPAEIKEGLASYIDKKGIVVFTLDSIETKMAGMNGYYYQGYLTYYNNLSKSIKIIDNKGKLVREINDLQPSDVFSPPFKDSVAVVSSAYNYKEKGLIDFEGNTLIKTSYENKDLINAGEGLFIRHKNDEMEFLDKTGKVIFSKHEGEGEGMTYNFKFYEGLARFSTGVKRMTSTYYTAEKHGFIDTKGNIVIPANFKYATRFSEGKALVGQSSPEAYWFIDKTGKDIFGKKFLPSRPENVELSKFQEGLANVKDIASKKAGYIDTTGNWVIPPIYEYTSDFSNGLGLGIKQDGLSQVFDRKGKVILEGYWNQSGIWWNDNLIYVSYIGSYFDRDGKLIWEKKVPFMHVSGIKQLNEVKNPELVSTVFIINDAWTTLPEKLWQCKNLKSLHLRQYDMATTLSANIYNFPQLRELYINLSKLEKLPNGISKLKNLEILQISDGRLAKLPIDFANLTKLKRAMLNSNMLTELPNGFEKLKNLTELSIDFNSIKRLPEGVFHMPRLNYFNFKKNLFINDANTIRRLSKVYPNAALTTRVAVNPK